MKILIWVTNGYRNKGRPESIYHLMEGLPRGTEKYTVEQLLDIGMVGWYKEEDIIEDKL